MRNRFGGVVLATVLGFSGCNSLSVATDFDREASFHEYRTFSWIGPNPLLSSPDTASPLAEERIQRAIAEVLAGKGIRFVADPAAADFVVAFTLGVRHPVGLDASLDSVGLVGTARWAFRYFSDVDSHEYREGRLAIDLFDVRSRNPVWHGYATRNLSGGAPKDPEGLVHEVVAAILETFPPIAPTDGRKPVRAGEK